jgi:hypothetical protein
MAMPINLGAPSLQIGQRGRFPQLPPQLQQPGQPMPAQAEGPPSTARQYGMAEALSQTQPVESGTWGEAIAEALAGGLRGRAARSEREREESLLAQELARQGKGDARDAEMQQAQIARLLAQTEAEQNPETWSEPFEHGGVQVQRNSRDNQYRPIGNPPAAMIYQPPAGYRGSAEGLSPIPGGPADVRATAEGRSRIQQMDSSARQLENAISVLGEAIPQVDWDSTGMVGQMMRGVGGTDAFNLDQQIEPVRAILSFENLAEMRRNSATGGALGSIAVRELELLSQTVRSLNTAQSTPQMRQALEATRAQLSATLQAVRAARQEIEAGPDAAPMEQMAPEGEQPRVRVWNRQTGRVE